MDFKTCACGVGGGAPHGYAEQDGKRIDAPPIYSMVMGKHLVATHEAFAGKDHDAFLDKLKAAGLPEVLQDEKKDVEFMDDPTNIRRAGDNLLREPKLMAVMKIGGKLIATIALPGGGIAIAEVERVGVGGMDSERAVHES
jgi:hypothetical protein